jgi:hypothetical protein
MKLSEVPRAREWFLAASHCYVAEHQGCVRCGARYCVLRSEWGSRVEYHCSACDFSACHDSQSGQSFMDPGDGVGLACTPRGCAG